MSKTQHTPTPYRIEPFFAGAEDGGSVDEGSSLMAEGIDEPLAIIGLTTYRYHNRYRVDLSAKEKETNRETDMANADFIVRACNCHDDLLAACEDIAEWLDRQAARSEQQVQDGRFASLDSAHRADAKNYRATLAHVNTAIAKANR